MLKGSIYTLSGLLLLLCGAVALTTLCIVNRNWISLFVLAPVLIMTVVGMYRLHLRNIRKLTFMFHAIENGDYAFRFTEYDSAVSDNMLNEALNRVKEILVKARMEAIERDRYYELILNSVNTGVLVINDAGSIYQINQEALRLFGLPQLSHVDRLRVIDQTLPGLLHGLNAGDKRHVSFSNERGTIQLSLSTSVVEVRKVRLRIVALNDINNELDEKETESWIRLIRVLTHEIMNSVTPITSLSDTLLQHRGGMDDSVREGLEVIHSTSRGLVHFVESYRQVTRIPEPHFHSFELQTLLNRITLLIRYDNDRRYEGRLDLCIVPDDLLMWADETLIGQLILNLLKNAVHAVQGVDQPRITLTASAEQSGTITIDITDNGTGIPPEVAENIFVPFFTTKRHGSGIGLSVSRQIMRLHNGNITLLYSHPGQTTFRLYFY